MLLLLPKVRRYEREMQCEAANRVQLSQVRVSWWDFVKALFTPASAVITTLVQRHQYLHFLKLLVVGILVKYFSMFLIRISTGKWAILDIVRHGFMQILPINGRNKLRPLCYISVPTIS
jgi:hypothetical protein